MDARKIDTWPVEPDSARCGKKVSPPPHWFLFVYSLGCTGGNSDEPVWQCALNWIGLVCAKSAYRQKKTLTPYMGVNPGHRPKHETVFALLHVRRSHPSCIVETSPMNSACCRLSTQASCFIHSCFACFLSAFRRGGGPSDWVIVGHFEWRRTCCFSEGLWFSPFFKNSTL